MKIERKLKEMGFELPTLSKPAASYISSVRVGKIHFVGGNIGRFDGQGLKYLRKVGDKVTVEQAYEMAQNCALNHLAKIKPTLGDLDQVERIVKINGYVDVAPCSKNMAKVVNGEFDFLVQPRGETAASTLAQR